MDNATVIGRQGAIGQGPFMVLYLRIVDEVVVESRFQTYGCPAAIACGSWVSEWLAGRTIQEAESLTGAQVNEGLGGLPLGKEHCPPLAIGALQAAVQLYGTGLKVT